jgi:hypothetical protein
MAEQIESAGNLAYFAWREAQERQLAAGAIDRAARCIHLTMAERYAALAREETAAGITSHHRQAAAFGAL